MNEMSNEIWRRRPDLNRGWRFCRPDKPYSPTDRNTPYFENPSAITRSGPCDRREIYPAFQSHRDSAVTVRHHRTLLALISLLNKSPHSLKPSDYLADLSACFVCQNPNPALTFVFVVCETHHEGAGVSYSEMKSVFDTGNRFARKGQHRSVRTVAAPRTLDATKESAACI